MSGGDIVVHGDVGGDPGAGMTGDVLSSTEDVLLHRRVTLRTLDKAEVKEINELLGEEDLHIPADAVCLAPTVT